MDGNSIKEIVLGGHRFKLRGVDDAYFASITADFESEFFSLCTRLIGPDYFCIYVGANIGVMSLFLSRHCPEGHVVAIEAAPTVAQCLEANLAINNVTNVHVEKTAVGDHKGSVGFVEASAWGHVSQNGSQVPITTLVDIVERLNLPRVDFIKIDVEGSEFPILRNSLNLINRFECLVLVELNSWAQLAIANVNPRDFIDWILASFSRVFMLRRGGSTGELLEPVTNGLDLLHRNLVADRCVTDLLLTNAEQRLVPSVAFLEAQLKASLASCVSLQGELSATQERVEGLRKKIAALSNSWSWRVTAPMRWIRDHLQKIKKL